MPPGIGERLCEMSVLSMEFIMIDPFRKCVGKGEKPRNFTYLPDTSQSREDTGEEDCPSPAKEFVERRCQPANINSQFLSKRDQRLHIEEELYQHPINAQQRYGAEFTSPTSQVSLELFLSEMPNCWL